MGNPGSDEKLEASKSVKQLQIKPVSKGCFVNAQPMWSFHNWGNIPGALLMPQCVAAAYQDVKQGFHVHSVQTQFLGIGTVAKPVTYRVENLNIGKTFATRQVKVEQNNKIIASTTVGFAKRAPVAGQGIVTLEHAAPPAMPMSTPEDESDELKYIHGDRNPTIKGYALPVVTRGTSQAPDSKLKRHWLRADGPISPVNGNMTNLLALIALSDIFLLDSAPRIYGLGLDLKTETSLSERLARDYKAMMTINHSIHIVNVDAVRVDEWIYVECEVPWASSGRVMVHSRMFSREGVLLATCVQEGLLLLRQGAGESKVRQKL